MKIEVISIYFDCEMEATYEIEVLRKDNKPLVTTKDVLNKLGMHGVLELWWKFYAWEKSGHNEYFCPDRDNDLVIIANFGEFYRLSSLKE